jgi:hypothetical protein
MYRSRIVPRGRCWPSPASQLGRRPPISWEAPLSQISSSSVNNASCAAMVRVSPAYGRQACEISILLGSLCLSSPSSSSLRAFLAARAAPAEAAAVVPVVVVAAVVVVVVAAGAVDRDARIVGAGQEVRPALASRLVSTRGLFRLFRSLTTSGGASAGACWAPRRTCGHDETPQGSRSNRRWRPDGGA